MTTQPIPSEQWAPIPGYVGLYEVSDQGRVRSVDRFIEYANGTRRFRKGRPMRGGTQGRYRTVLLSPGGGKVRNHTVHSLVLAAFVGPRPEGMDVCHGDGDCTNNRLDNLRYDTREANVEDMRRHGSLWQVHKTHCKNGHPFDEENTVIRVNAKGREHRQCRECIRLAKRASHLRRQARASERTP